jgi:hypothetical protein
MTACSLFVVLLVGRLGGWPARAGVRCMDVARPKATWEFCGPPYGMSLPRAFSLAWRFVGSCGLFLFRFLLHTSKS